MINLIYAESSVIHERIHTKGLTSKLVQHYNIEIIILR